jgi:hypothetical protein
MCAEICPEIAQNSSGDRQRIAEFVVAGKCHDSFKSLIDR